MMLKNDANYTRLKKFGGRGSYMGSSSYWLAQDHLLIVEVSNYNERYRRFYFRDVQAVIIQRNKYRMFTNIVAGLLAVLPAIGVGALLSDGEYGGAAVVGAFVLLFLGILLINSLRGPTCAMHVRTAVQTQKLPGIVRWARAESLLEILTPQVQAAQPLAAETFPAAATPANPSENQPGLP